ncbi:MAG: hypothetical protein RM021_022675 [Nostoc sp. EkiNYC01]|nr:hypothetical protein [Nostoc sp. EkiNYC01]
MVPVAKARCLLTRPGITHTLRILGRIGGQVSMDSKISQGSRFWIELPEFTK